MQTLASAGSVLLSHEHRLTALVFIGQRSQGKSHESEHWSIGREALQYHLLVVSGPAKRWFLFPGLEEKSREGTI